VAWFCDQLAQKNLASAFIYEKTAHGSLFCNSGKNQTAFFSCLFRPVSIEVET
jgi:hypothetical protein